MSARRWAVVLPLLAAVVTGVVVAAYVASPADGFGRELVPARPWLHGLVGVAAAFLGGVLIDSGRRRFGAMVLSFSVLYLGAALVTVYLQWSLVDPVAPGDPGAGRIVALCWVAKVLGVTAELNTSLVLLLFPDGRLLRGLWGRLGAVSFLGSALANVIQVLAPGSVAFVPELRSATASVLLGDHTLGAPFATGLLETLALPSLIWAVLICLPVQLATPVIRFRRAGGIEAERLYWVLWAVVATTLAVAVQVIVLEGHIESWLVSVGATVMLVAMAVGLLDQSRVSGQELLANTLVYGGLWVGVLALDVAFLAGLTMLLGDSLGQRDVVLVVLLFSAVVYGPLRAALWRGVRRWLLGQRDDPYDVVAGLAAGLERAEEGPAQLGAVARAVSQAFGVSFVSVEVERVAGARLAATLGTRPRETRSLPISYRGATVGRLVLPARGLRTQLSRRDERLLGDLVRQAAAAARTTQLADELQANREELVLAREEERRRIRRDLHDGLGPSLGGAVFQLDSARLLVDRDPATAEAQLRATEAHLRDVMDDVRRLVSDLRPPTLDTLGLLGALRQQGDLVAGVDVRVAAHDPVALALLPAAVEVAAYRIVGEALTNVARHAGATTCTVSLSVAADGLVVEVVDDGGGIPAERQAGVGLLSLRERADELGGRTEITCPPGGGTVVRAWLPIAAPVPHPNPNPHPNRAEELV